MKINLPKEIDKLKELKAGDYVEISGEIYTARDAAHKRLIELLERNEELPLKIENAGIYYVGPTPARKQTFGSAGPTTSSRMDKYTPALLDLGLKYMIGKGVRNKEVKDSIVKNQAVYFVAAGGAGALLASHVVDWKSVAFEDLLSEAIVKLVIKDFPVFVGIDCQGKDIYE